MAYSLGDYFRPLRIVLRISGLTLGVGAGGGLLVLPRALLQSWQLIAADGPAWPTRGAGAMLMALGCLFLLAAAETMINRPVLIATTVAHGLLAIVLLVAYVQQEFAGLSPTGTLVLIGVFLLCLFGAVVPLRYVRTEYGSY